MAPHFGSKVTGQDAYDKAVREEVGGASTFGVRVRGAIPADGPTNIAKRVTEHGPRVVNNASFQDAKGDEVDAVSIDDLRNILAENPTTFDSLYEAELAREDGARPEALDIFYEVERGIKGQGRQDVMNEIQSLLKTKRKESDRQADQNRLHTEVIERQMARQEVNATLRQASTAAALVKLEEDKAALKKAGVDVDEHKADVDVQLAQAGKKLGIEPAGVEQDTRGPGERGKTKPEGDVNPETQQPGERLGVPKKTRSGSKKKA